jgi:hypothetical protein
MACAPQLRERLIFVYLDTFPPFAPVREPKKSSSFIALRARHAGARWIWRWSGSWQGHPQAPDGPQHLIAVFS